MFQRKVQPTFSGVLYRVTKLSRTSVTTSTVVDGVKHVMMYVGN